MRERLGQNNECQGGKDRHGLSGEERALILTWKRKRNV